MPPFNYSILPLQIRCVQPLRVSVYCDKHGLKLVKIYKDTHSGKTILRPGIQRLLKDRDKFQVLVVYKIDRLSRSVLDLLRLLREDLKGKEVVFIQESIDQRTKEGRLFLTQLASFAEYERELIVSRIKDGLAEARKRGVKLGREPKYVQFKEQVIRMRKNNLTWGEICARLKVDYRTARKCIG